MVREVEKTAFSASTFTVTTAIHFTSTLFSIAKKAPFKLQKINNTLENIEVALG